jgi:hypothetical protein
MCFYCLYFSYCKTVRNVYESKNNEGALQQRFYHVAKKKRRVIWILHMDLLMS